MKNLLLTSLLFYSVCTLGQSIKQSINEQVWKPFIESFNAHDTKRFMNVHSKEVVRAPRDSKSVWNWQEYYSQQEKGDKRELESKANRTLELRFNERIHSSEQGIEVGIYKTTYQLTDGRTNSYYGRFHVVLRKENGVWKILVDTDSSENNSIGEKEFLAALPME